VAICLERDADLHMAQLMPLPLTVSCLSKIQTGFTRVVLEKGPLNGCVIYLCSSYNWIWNLCNVILVQSVVCFPSISFDLVMAHLQYFLYFL